MPRSLPPCPPSPARSPSERAADRADAALAAAARRSGAAGLALASCGCLADDDGLLPVVSSRRAPAPRRPRRHVDYSVDKHVAHLSLGRGDSRYSGAHHGGGGPSSFHAHSDVTKDNSAGADYYSYRHEFAYPGEGGHQYGGRYGGGHAGDWRRREGR